MKYLYTIKIKNFPPKERPIKDSFLETGVIISQEVEFKKMNDSNKEGGMAWRSRDEFKEQLINEYLEITIKELKK